MWWFLLAYPLGAIAYGAGRMILNAPVGYFVGVGILLVLCVLGGQPIYQALVEGVGFIVLFGVIGMVGLIVSGMFGGAFVMFCTLGAMVMIASQLPMFTEHTLDASTARWQAKMAKIDIGHMKLGEKFVIPDDDTPTAAPVKPAVAPTSSKAWWIGGGIAITLLWFFFDMFKSFARKRAEDARQLAAAQRAPGAAQRAYPASTPSAPTVSNVTMQPRAQ